MMSIRSLYLLRDTGSLCCSSGRQKHCIPQLQLISWNMNYFRSLKTSNLKLSRWSRAKSSSSNLKPTLRPPELSQGLRESDSNSLSRLWKPFLFTVGFSTVSIGGSAIWQYENMRALSKSQIDPWSWIQGRTKQQKIGEWRQQVNRWWNNLTEGEKLFVPICFLNCLVFLAWRVPVFLPVMQRYFSANPATSVVCLPMVLSTFSHYSFLHLAANMFVLHSFSTGAAASLGKEQLLGLYLSAGCVSSFTSYIYKVMLKTPGPSIGASGAILAVLAYVCSRYPDTQLSIIFLPMITFSASVGIKAIMALDGAGILLGWKFFDHAAHLGGALYGLGWYWWGNTYVWNNRGPLLQAWHDFRGATNK